MYLDFTFNSFYSGHTKLGNVGIFQKFKIFLALWGTLPDPHYFTPVLIKFITYNKCTPKYYSLHNSRFQKIWFHHVLNNCKCKDMQQIMATETRENLKTSSGKPGRSGAFFINSVMNPASSFNCVSTATESELPKCK